MRRPLLIILAVFALPGGLAAQQPEVQILPPQLAGSRPIEAQTESAVVQDYLASWSSMAAALARNQPSLLDADFVGTARAKLGDTISQQAAAGIHTAYKTPSHKLTFVFYSPEGSSIQLIDTVSYEEEILAGDQAVSSHPVSVRYLVVMTPSQVRWQVRIFQAAGAGGK